jgi:hypothetical protein
VRPLAEIPFVIAMVPMGGLEPPAVSPPPPTPEKDFIRFCRKNLEKFDNCRRMGGKMTYAEFQKLLLLADRMITSSAPKKTEYGRGYHMGIQIHFNNDQPGSLPDHYSIAEIARRNGCRNVHAFARGYRDGCMGLKPEYTG